ncbi:M48 family metallopeptidase [Larkinella sp. C7]|jgi:Zn-dependent protease with chaperone function|uniref:M48 family metallopeptidase n=1 Tax=Larkinella sp. C7 TaxID=2576607 RepID=UPI0011112899|nr:M48 family metallopeptidase [Larkinella sp. C7]
MKIMRINLLMGMLLVLPLTLVAQKGKKKKEESKPEITAPKPVAPVVPDTPVDEVPLDKTGKGIIIEFKPPYKYMLVLAENDEEGRYSHVFMTDSTLFPKRRVSYSKGVRRKVKPQDLLTPSSFRAGMEISFHFDHYQRTLRNIAKEFYLDDDYFGKAKVSGILEFRDGNRAIIDGQEVRMDPKAEVKGQDEWKNKTFNSFNQMQLGAELTVTGRRDTSGVIFVKSGTMRPVEISKDDLLMRRAINKALFMNKDVLQIGKDMSYRFVTERNLFAYVNDVGQKLIPEYLKSLDPNHPDFINFKFYLVHDDTFNASAYPNGTVIVHTGLIKQLENEAQLAAILGHEIAHVTQRHHTKSYRTGKDWQALADFGSTVTGYQTGSDVPAKLIQAAKDMYHSSYNREQETQADRIGLQYMFMAGYDPRQAAKVWSKLARDEKEAGESPEEAAALQYVMNASETGEQRQDNSQRASDLAATGYALRSQNYAMLAFRNVAAKKGESVYSSHPRSLDRFNHVNFLLSTAFAYTDFNTLETNEPDFKKIQAQLKKIVVQPAPGVKTPDKPGDKKKNPKTPGKQPGNNRGKTFVKPQ